VVRQENPDLASMTNPANWTHPQQEKAAHILEKAKKH